MACGTPQVKQAALPAREDMTPESKASMMVTTLNWQSESTGGWLPITVRSTDNTSESPAGRAGRTKQTNQHSGLGVGFRMESIRPKTLVVYRL